jgi:hypothetical protein
MTDKTNGKTGYTKMISIQIAAPQRTTNPANESQTSRSSRVMFRVPLDDVGLAAKCGYPAALMRYLNNRVQSCYRAPVIWFSRLARLSVSHEQPNVALNHLAVCVASGTSGETL